MNKQALAELEKERHMHTPTAINERSYKAECEELRKRIKDAPVTELCTEDFVRGLIIDTMVDEGRSLIGKTVRLVIDD